MRYCILVLSILLSVGHIQAQLIDGYLMEQDSSNEAAVDTPWILKAYHPPTKGPLYDSALVLPNTAQLIDDKLIKPRTENTPHPWLFAVFLTQLFLLVVIRLVFDKDLFAQLRAYFNLNLSQQLQREMENTIPFSTLLLNINGFISLAALIYLTLIYFGLIDRTGDFQFFTIILGFTTGVLVLKYLAMKLMANIFPIAEELDLYNFNFFLNHQLLGIVLVPLNMVIAYGIAVSPFVFTILALLVVGLSFILLTIKGLTIGISYFRFYKFHFIIYICTLEIAPILVLYKVFMQVI